LLRLRARDRGQADDERTDEPKHDLSPVFLFSRRERVAIVPISSPTACRLTIHDAPNKTGRQSAWRPASRRL